MSIYQLATSATGEFTAQNGGTVASALAAIVTVVNGVNAVYRRDFGIHLELIEETDQVIYTEPSPLLPTQDLQCEGPPNCMAPDCLLTGNQCVLDAVIGSANYDVGIVFDATAPDGSAAGRASLYAVCDPSLKGRGATGGTFVVLAAHEIGHMFGGHHTFNDGMNGSCGSPGERDASWAYEPGSGSTLMSYAGTCGSANLQNSRDLVFHSENVRHVLGFILSGKGLACSSQAFSGNYAPVVQIPPGNHTVPARTPFLLEVQAYDPNSDPVTYSFEATNTGAASPPEADDGTRPIARAYAPSATPRRSFPRETFVLQNANVPPPTVTCGTSTCLTGEVLPTMARTMDWTVILRDGVDGVTFTGAIVTVNAGSGPFEVTQPTGSTVWTEGTIKTVTWNPANTQNAPVSCANVRILLSLDGGSTWPHVLAASTPNDGAETVTLPFGTSGLSRIKVEAVGNIFYDVSEGFTIRELSLTTTADSGPGSLRQAILDANDRLYGATIPVRIPGTGVRTIQVLTQLPTIVKPVSLDAWELGGPDYTGPPLLEIAGGGCPDAQPGVRCDGLTVHSDNLFLNGLVVRNFPGNGIVLRGAGAYTGVIQNSYIGIDAAGTDAAGNGKSGILIDGGYGDPAYGNLIDRNVISGNEVGVTILGSGANGNTLTRNRVGTNAAGTARIPNLDDGVRIVGAPNTRIGEPGGGNVISGNGTVTSGFVSRYADAIDVGGAGASGTVIEGNTIGLDVTGTTGLYNTAGEIRVTNAPSTRIGGTAAGARNVVGDDGTVNFNAAHCILVSGAGATGTVIEGNYLGTDAGGTLSRGCRGAGVFVDGAPGVRIGGTTAAARNVISGNRTNGGVWITNGASGTVVQGNYVGIDATGTVAVANHPFGVALVSGGNTIGGTAPGTGNVISGNTQRGIDLNEIGASNNVIQGNLIGTNAAGTAAVPNGVYGIHILRAENNRIGGTTPGARNVISGNGSTGIYVAGSDGQRASGNTIEGNYIGTDVAGAAALGNGGGIELYYTAGVVVGGSSPGAGNVISASRAGTGVVINSFGLATSGNVVQGNRIGTNADGTAALGNAGDGVWGSITGTASLLGNVIAGSGSNGVSLAQGSFTVQGNWIGTDTTGTLDLRNTWSGIYTTSPAACSLGGVGPGRGTSSRSTRDRTPGRTTRGSRWPAPHRVRRSAGTGSSRTPASGSTSMGTALPPTTPATSIRGPTGSRTSRS